MNNLVRVVRIRAPHQFANNNWLLEVVQRCASHSGFVSDETYWSESSTHRTVVKPQIPIFRNLHMFLEVLQHGQLLRPDLKSNWNPRLRLGIAGGTVDGADFGFVRVGDFPHYINGNPTGALTDLKVGCFSHPTTGLFVRGIDLVEFMKQLHLENPVDFKQTGTYVSGGITREVEQRFTWIRYKPGEYILKYYGVVRPKAAIGKSMRSYIMDIRVDPIDNSVHCSLSNGYYRNLTAAELETGPTYGVAPENYRQVCFYDKVPTTGIASVKLRQSDASIMRFAPLLYHTQSKAVSSYWGNVSRNFETLTEAAGLFPAIFDLAKSPAAATTTWLRNLPLVDRLVAIVKVAAGAKLAWDYAIAPTLQTIQDVLVSASESLQQVSGEGTITYHGDYLDSENLPKGLHDFLMQLSWGMGHVERYEIRTRSQIMQNMRVANVVTLTSEYIKRATQFGFIPSPTQIYRAQPFTFVLDWLLPVGQHIEAAENRVKAFGTNCVSIGHTVYVSVWTSNGNRVELFIRSTATDRYLDPVGESWLQAPGAPVTASLPLAVTVLL